jgi:16S rRNA (cytosine967-C5)-methyltransferase
VADVSAARREAFRILLAVEGGQPHSDDLLRGKAVSALSAADRNLATTLVLGVLRWQIWLDGVIRPLLKRPNAKLDAEVLIALRLGAFQLLFLDRIPAHAAIDESVELAKQAGQRFASGMVNAVLRRMARDAESVRVSDGREEKASAGAEARTNHTGMPAQLKPHSDASRSPDAEAHPAWLVERWVAHYGDDAAHAICRHGQSQPALALRMVAPEAADELARAGVELAPGELLDCARVTIAGDVAATDAFHEGRVRIQDEGSQLIAELAGTTFNQEQGKMLDACAAPGGKTLILAERHPQAQVVACESSAPRSRQLRERLAAHAGHMEFRLVDAAALEDESVFDLALVDAPCSGTGTLGRNPEIRHRLHVEDLARHAERQRAILRAAMRAVRPGGRVIYSTCSLEPEENEQVVAAVLAEAPHACQLSLASNIDSLCEGGILTVAGAERLREQLTPEGALRLLPGYFHTDGFFIAQIEIVQGESM